MLLCIKGSAGMKSEVCKLNRENERFVKLMDSIRDNVSDSTLVEHMATMGFYKEPSFVSP